jgi:two-component system, OmpR family, phosphate regulon sensor histidine kinase PhoR
MSRQKLGASAVELGAAQAVLAALPDPLILLDERRRILRANGAANELLGMRLVERDLAVAIRHPAVLDAADAVLRGGASRIVEFDITTPVERHLSARLAAVRPHTTEGAAAVLTLHDLTAAKRSERLRADFAANASHELRTPLASLTGFIETLRGPAREDSAARGRFLTIMAEQAQRMAHLVDDLLSLSRIEQKVHIHPDTTADLVMIVNEVTDGLLPLARERDVEIKISDQVDSLEVMGDRDELIRVFENLIENALKYGASGKRVDITLNRDPAIGEPRDAFVSVRDYGPGIAPEHLPRLTERFYRVDIGESRAQGGTGLGLALVKHILNRHRGRLMIESTPGAGANFSVRLPLSRGRRVAKI